MFIRDVGLLLQGEQESGYGWTYIPSHPFASRTALPIKYFQLQGPPQPRTTQ